MTKDNFFQLTTTTLPPEGIWTNNNTDIMVTECRSQYSCNGCNQVRICSTTPDGKFREASLVNCTGVTPYCKEDSGTCTGIMPEKCAPVSESFMCMRESGSYPDPTNCTRFHVCKNYTAYAFECYAGTLYNSRTGECERTECYKFNCATKHGLKIPFGTNKNVYGYCVHGLLWFIDRCPINYELNELTQNCEPVCRIEGYLPDVTDNSKYFVCRKDHRNIVVPQKYHCPSGAVFDPDYAHCILS